MVVTGGGLRRSRRGGASPRGGLAVRRARAWWLRVSERELCQGEERGLGLGLGLGLRVSVRVTGAYHVLVAREHVEGHCKKDDRGGAQGDGHGKAPERRQEKGREKVRESKRRAV